MNAFPDSPIVYNAMVRLVCISPLAKLDENKTLDEVMKETQSMIDAIQHDTDKLRRYVAKRAGKWLNHTLPNSNLVP